MSSIAGVKDEIRFDGETKVGGFRFQKYIQQKVVHIHNPEDQKVEYPIDDFLKSLDTFMLRLKDISEGETIRLRDLFVTMRKGKIELDLKGCKDTVNLDEFQKGMSKFNKLLEDR